MKRFFDLLFSIGESMGRARAAAMFTRMGDLKSAKQIMMK